LGSPFVDTALFAPGGASAAVVALTKVSKLGESSVADHEEALFACLKVAAVSESPI
jgi:hypothetical protein